MDAISIGAMAVVLLGLAGLLMCIAQVQGYMRIPKY